MLLLASKRYIVGILQHGREVKEMPLVELREIERIRESKQGRRN